MSDGFAHAIGGRLRLKGEDGVKKKKKKTRRVKEHIEKKANDEVPQTRVILEDGDGLVQSSSTVLMGTDTRFRSQLAIGDVILVTVVDHYEETTAEEEREVRMVVGDTSCNLSAPFSCDVTDPTPFRVRKVVTDGTHRADADQAPDNGERK